MHVCCICVCEGWGGKCICRQRDLSVSVLSLEEERRSLLGWVALPCVCSLFPLNVTANRKTKKKLKIKNCMLNLYVLFESIRMALNGVLQQQPSLHMYVLTLLIHWVSLVRPSATRCPFC